MKNIFIFLMAFIVLSCNSSDDTEKDPCLLDINQGISIGVVVKVFDATSNEFIDEGIVVKAIGEGRSIRLLLGTDSDTGEKGYFGISINQEGTYRINIINIDYEVFYSEPFTISRTEDGCQLDTEHLEVTLQPI